MTQVKSTKTLKAVKSRFYQDESKQKIVYIKECIIKKITEQNTSPAFLSWKRSQKS